MEARDSQGVRVLRIIEELLAGRSPDQRPVDTKTVAHRMGLAGQAAEDEVARTMSELVADGYIEGKELRGDNKAMDVTVTRITETGRALLDAASAGETEDDPFEES